MDPIAAKYIAAGLSCIGIGLSSIGVMNGVRYFRERGGGTNTPERAPFFGLFVAIILALCCVGFTSLLLFAA
jgi:hypothetical protein